MRYERALASAPKSGSDVFDAMCVEMIDLLFADEQMALETLGNNFDRLAFSMDRIANGPAFSGDSHTVRTCELGGGTGLISMFLLITGKSGFCEVIDRAAQPLAIGKSWAAKLGLANISFRQASYADLQASGTADFDFVFAEHALDFDPKTEKDLNPLEPNGLRSIIPPAYSQLAEGMRRLLRPKGIGLVGSGIATPSALASMCCALRQSKLPIDWRLTSNRKGLQSICDRMDSFYLIPVKTKPWRSSPMWQIIAKRFLPKVVLSRKYLTQEPDTWR
jgi:hypothetical protein